MKLECIDSCWKFLPAGGQDVKQCVYSEGEQRLRYTENPDDPVKELERFVDFNKNFSMLILPPCSLESVLYAHEHFENVLIVDYNEGRLALFKEITSNKFKTLLTPSEDELCQSLKEYDADLSFGKVVSYLPSRYARLDHRLKYLLKEGLLKIQQEFCSFAVNKSLKSWHRTLNAVENIKNIETSILSLPNIDGKDTLIVGAGPSLDDTVHKILEKQNSFYIIATDGSLKTLLRNNIKPDFIVSCEDTVMSWQFVNGCLDVLQTVPLVAPYNANHYLLKNYKGPLCITRSRVEEEWTTGIIDTLPEVNTGRCVGHYAFNLAIALGAGRIIMTGFDLAFKGDVFHPRDMAVPYFHEMDVPVPVSVESVDGGDIRTDLSMKTYLKDFEYMIKHTPLDVIDATEGGALIKGARIKSLNELSYDCIKKKPLSYSDKKNNLFESFNAKRAEQKEFYESLALCFTSYLVQNSKEIDSKEKTKDRELAFSILESLLMEPEHTKEFVEAVLLPKSYTRMDAWFIWALSKGLKLIEQDSLCSLLRKVKSAGVDCLYCINGEIPPDLAALTDIECKDIKTTEEKTVYERSLWLKKYSILTSEGLLGKWQDIVPGHIQLYRHESVNEIEKVGNGN